MIKKMLGVFTSVIAALAVVGVAWAGTDDATSTSVTAAGETSTDVSIDDSSSSTDATIASSTDATVQSSTEATVASSTGATVDSTTSTGATMDSSTSTSLAATTSTSADSNSSTSTTVESTTSTSTDDNDRTVVPDGISVHTIPGVGSVTIEAVLGKLILVDVSAPGWNVEFDEVESDRIELEFTSAAEAEAEFEARINDGHIEVRIEVD